MIYAAIAFLLLCSAFFSASETALTAASRPVMHHLGASGNRRALLVEWLQNRTDQFLGTILLGNTLVNILASSLATSALIVAFGEVGIVYATVSLTALVLIFGEIMPKTYAFRRANHVALWVAPPINLIVRLLLPVTAIINLLVRFALIPFGIDRRRGSSPNASEAELRGAIMLHAGAASGVLQEGAMLNSILDLAQVEVGEVMTHRKSVIMIDADDPPEAVLAQVLESPFTRFPLWRDSPENVIGVVHAKDLLRAVHAHASQLSGFDIAALASKPWFIPDTTTLYAQLQAFRRRHEHFAHVVDEYGSLMGIVTLEDILEEIVGEIADEHDPAVPGATREADGSIIVPGTATIRDINREFGWRLPDEEAVTLAGLLLREARRIPEAGEAFSIEGFTFRVLRRQRHQITAIRIMPPTEAGDAAKEG